MNANDSVGYIISNTGRKLSQVLSLQFQPYDITSEQWSVLKRLAEQDGITQKELSVRTEKDQTNITRILDQLERKGWVRRAAKEGDRRSYLAFVTDSGRTLNGKLLPIEAEFIGKITADLSGQEIKALRDILLQINRTLES